MHGWPLADLGELGWQIVPCTDRKFSLDGKGGSWCLNCVNNVVYAEYPFSFWKSGILVCAKQRVSVWPAPNKNAEH